jgi:hypothetical protein
VEQLTSIATENNYDEGFFCKKGEADASEERLLFNGRTGQHLLLVPLIVASHEDRLN